MFGIFILVWEFRGLSFRFSKSVSVLIFEVFLVYLFI